MTNPEQNKKDCCEKCRPVSFMPVVLCTNPLCKCHSVAKEGEMVYHKESPDNREGFGIYVTKSAPKEEKCPMTGRMAQCSSDKECFHLDEAAPQEKDWQKDWLLFAPEYGKWKIDRRVAIPFISQVEQQAEERGYKQGKQDIAEEIKEAKSELFIFRQNREYERTQAQKELLGKIEKMIEGKKRYCDDIDCISAESLLTELKTLE